MPKTPFQMKKISLKKSNNYDMICKENVNADFFHDFVFGLFILFYLRARCNQKREEV
jgi:hypothetical protein